MKRGGIGYTEAAYGLWTSGNKLYAEIKNYNRSSNASLTGNTALAVGTWSHVALRRDDAGEVSLWVNGVKQTATGIVTGTRSILPATSYIGRHNYSSSEDFAGTIDEVRIHNRALDPGEFNSLPRGLSPSSFDTRRPSATRTRIRTPCARSRSRSTPATPRSASILVRVYDLSGSIDLRQRLARRRQP